MELIGLLITFPSVYLAYGKHTTCAWGCIINHILRSHDVRVLYDIYSRGLYESSFSSATITNQCILTNACVEEGRGQYAGWQTVWQYIELVDTLRQTSAFQSVLRRRPPTISFSITVKHELADRLRGSSLVQSHFSCGVELSRDWHRRDSSIEQALKDISRRMRLNWLAAEAGR